MSVALMPTPRPERPLAATARLLTRSTLAALATPLLIAAAWVASSGSTLSWVVAAVAAAYVALAGTLVGVVMGQLRRDLAEEAAEDLAAVTTDERLALGTVIPFPLVRAEAG